MKKELFSNTFYLWYCSINQTATPKQMSNSESQALAQVNSITDLFNLSTWSNNCLLYTSDAADE